MLPDDTAEVQPTVADHGIAEATALPSAQLSPEALSEAVAVTTEVAALARLYG